MKTPPLMAGLIEHSAWGVPGLAPGSRSAHRQDTQTEGGRNTAENYLLA